MRCHHGLFALMFAATVAFAVQAQAQVAQPRQQDLNAQGQAQPQAQPQTNPQGQPQGQPGAIEARRNVPDAAAGGNRRFNVNPQGGPMMRGGRSTDQELAACLTIDNEGEVWMGKFAQQRAKNDEVKQFAEQMVKDHSQMIEKLQRFAGEGQAANNANAAPQNNQANQINNETAAAATRGQPARQPGARMQAQQGPLDHLAFKRELAEQCKQTLEREFSQKSASEFDHCYMGQQIGAHLHAIDVMKVARNHASPDLQAVLDEGIKTAEGHLAHAKELEEKTESK